MIRHRLFVFPKSMVNNTQPIITFNIKIKISYYKFTLDLTSQYFYLIDRNCLEKLLKLQ